MKRKKRKSKKTRKLIRIKRSHDGSINIRTIDYIPISDTANIESDIDQQESRIIKQDNHSSTSEKSFEIVRKYNGHSRKVLKSSRRPPHIPPKTD